uniref:ORF1 n=1 Tax=Euplotes crassus TaxID=5936 RepID=Q94559_EUPCR|nr:ORF1 [Moneuplotes crassus]
MSAAVEILNNEASKRYEQAIKHTEDKKLDRIDINEQAAHQIPKLDIYVHKSCFDAKVKTKRGSFRSKNMKKFSSNIIIIEKMLMVDERSLEYVSKWLGMSVKTFKTCLDRYFRSKSINKDKSRENMKLKLQRSARVKELAELYISRKQGRCITTKAIRDFANEEIKDNSIKEFSYYEIKRCLVDDLGYSWQRGNTRPPSSLRPNIGEGKQVFKQFIKQLEVCKFTVVYIDECSFNRSALPLYTWHAKGTEAPKLIRSSNQRYNCIAAQVCNHKLFHVKQDTTKEDSFIEFLENLHDKLRTILSKRQLSKRTIYVFDNASIHLTQKVVKCVTDRKMVCFTIPPYCPELNKVEHTFGLLKNNLSKDNLASRDFLYLIKKNIEGC